MNPKPYKKHIFKPDFFGKPYGGNLYDYKIHSVTKEKFKFEWINTFRINKKLLTIFHFSLLFLKSKFKRDQIIFLNFLSLPFFPLFNKNTIILIHHIDWSKSPLSSKIYQIICYIIFKLLKNKWRTIVVVSKYWKEHLESKGFKNIKIIYNSIEIIKEENLLSRTEFLKIYNLPSDKKFIYLGNAQKGKGWLDAYEKLKDLNVIFIITGVSNYTGKLPSKVHYLYLKYIDYQAMLKYAECTILLSQFKEGWNRIAHESMLQKTPVIGSGIGGMRELLEEGHQLICHDIDKLPELTEYSIQNRVILGIDGFDYVKQFDLDYFRKSWEDVFDPQINK